MNAADKVSAKINAIRNAALASLGAEPHSKCPTCGRNGDAPYRRHDERGKITEGCIDAFHSDRLYLGSSLFWHNRPEAKELRRAELARIR